MFREFLDSAGEQHTNGRIHIREAHSMIKKCLHLDGVNESRCILHLLLHWSITGDGYLPVASIFRMLRVVKVTKLADSRKEQVI